MVGGGAKWLCMFFQKLSEHPCQTAGCEVEMLESFLLKGRTAFHCAFYLTVYQNYICLVIGIVADCCSLSSKYSSRALSMDIGICHERNKCRILETQKKHRHGSVNTSTQVAEHRLDYSCYIITQSRGTVYCHRTSN